MPLQHLRTTDFRNIATASLQFSADINLILGGNGAGKTSILEAIYLLGYGKSFRNSRLDALIRKGQDGFSVFGEVFDHTAACFKVGIGRQEKKTSYKINGEEIATLSEFIRILPVQFIGPDSHRLLEEGPEIRRKFLDWGVFHVEPNFYAMWKQYYQALKQRNAALRNNLNIKEIISWDELLIHTASAIHEYRKHYIQALSPFFLDIAKRLTNVAQLKIDYYPGWSEERDFAANLSEQLPSDRAHGYTRIGPHRADLKIKVSASAAKDWVSRGQQKLIVISLILAQVAVYRELKDKAAVLLLDDIASELDKDHCKNVIAILESLETQLFFTGLHQDQITPLFSQIPKMFHVERGNLKEMV